MLVKLLIATVLCGMVAIVASTETNAGSQKPKRKTPVSTKYDKKKDETVVRMDLQDVWRPPGNPGQINLERLDLMVSFSYPGKKIATPQIVKLTVFSNSQWGQLFDSKRDLSFSTGTGQFKFGEMKLLASHAEVVPDIGPGHSRGPLVREVVEKAVPFSDFKQIAHAENAEFKIGDREFKLTPDHLEAFRNFVLLMEQEGLEF